MIRMTLLLTAAIGLTLTIAGRDQGQMRAGLMQAQARQTTETYRYIPVQTPAPMMAAAAAPATEVAAPVEAPALSTAFVTADQLNVRQGPSTGQPALDKLAQGEEVSVIRTEGRWTLIRLEGNGVEGWVASSYLTAMPLRMAGN